MNKTLHLVELSRPASPLSVAKNKHSIIDASDNMAADARSPLFFMLGSCIRASLWANQRACWCSQAVILQRARTRLPVSWAVIGWCLQTGWFSGAKSSPVVGYL